MLARQNPINDAQPLSATNKGYKLLLKMGWGKKGLGTEEQGRTAPVSVPPVRSQWNQSEGLGVRETAKEYGDSMVSSVMMLAGLNTYGITTDQHDGQLSASASASTSQYSSMGFSTQPSVSGPYDIDLGSPDIFQHEGLSSAKQLKKVDEPWYTKWMRNDFHEMMAEVECIVAFSYEMLQNQMNPGHVRSLMPECPKRIILRTHDAVLKMEANLCVICNIPASEEHHSSGSHHQAYLMKQMRFGLKAFKQIYGTVPISNIKTNGGSNLAVEAGHFSELPAELPGIQARVYRIMVLYAGEYLKRKCPLCDIQLEKEPYKWVQHIESMDHATAFINKVREMDTEKFVKKFKYAPAPWPWTINKANQALLEIAKRPVPQIPRPKTPDFLRPSPRLCILRLRTDFKGYGFNLRGSKTEGAAVGHYIAKVAPNSPAACASLKEGDRIIEVAGLKTKPLAHIQVVNLIKANPKTVRLLVVDPATDDYYKQRNIEVIGTMPGIQVNISKLPTSLTPVTPLVRPIVSESAQAQAAGHHRQSMREMSPPPPPPPPPPPQKRQYRQRQKEESPPPPPPPPRKQDRKPMREESPPPPPPPQRKHKRRQMREDSPPPPPPPPPKKHTQHQPDRESQNGRSLPKRAKEESILDSLPPPPWETKADDSTGSDAHTHSAEEVEKDDSNKKRLVSQIQNLTGLEDEKIVQNALLILEKAGLDVLQYLSRLDPERLKVQVQRKLESGDDKLLLLLQRVMQFGQS